MYRTRLSSYRAVARQLSSINGKIAAYRARSDVCHGASREKIEAQIRQLIAEKRAILSGLQLDALTVEQLARAHRVLFARLAPPLSFKFP
jgi:hypothetical protein